MATMEKKYVIDETRKRRAAAAVVLLFLSDSSPDEEDEESNKRKWMKPCLRGHDCQGAYPNLVKELETCDLASYRNFLRMSPDQFRELVERVRPYIARKDTNFRTEERLAVTLRFLATGESYKSLSYSFRLGSTTIGKIIPETCQTLYNVLKDDNLKMDCLSTLQVVLVMCIVPQHLTLAYRYYRSPYTESARDDRQIGRRASYSRNPTQLSRSIPLFNIPGFPKRQDNMCSVNGPSDIRRLLPGRFMSESELLSIVPNSFNRNEHKPTYTSLKRIVVSRFTESGFSKPGTAQYINDGICGCCVTELSYEIMTEITDFNGQNHTIINFNNSYQFIPAGKCSNENAPCAGGTARCKQVTRAHWSLVWTPSVGARLVAHEVPSHCQCINLGAAASSP